MATVKVLVAGVNGRMGRASLHAIAQEPDIKLVGAFGRPDATYAGKDVAELVPLCDSAKTGILVSNGFLDALTGETPDVMLEFTEAKSALEHAKQALAHGIRPVIGTSGLNPDGVKELELIAASKKLGALIVPNFSIGAVLMMEFARQAAQMFENVEIVEMHHNKKTDAPSGTASHTARQIASSGRAFNAPLVQEKELLQGARGGLVEAGVRIHSLRLPGLISHQEVIFGSDGELLTIKHDSFNASCFTKGIRLAVKAVMDLDHLVVGLDKVLPGLA